MPTRSALENAFRDPKRFAPAIERLGGGRIATDRDGNIFSPGGSDALVVRLDRPTGQSIALRIPFLDDGDPAALGVHAAFAVDPVISELRTRTPSPVAGGVSVIPRGLLLPVRRGEPRPFPVIAMEWVGDFTLTEVVRRMVARNDIVRISGLGTQFQRLMQALAESRFSHGDLTPDNIVLRRGDAMTIVDYDSAAWPGSPRGRAGNTSRAYRHPSGSVPVVMERRDDFAALVILVTLRALSVDPGMLFPPSDHHEHGLLLSARDLQNPAASDRFRRLASIDDAETVALSGILAEVCGQPVDQTPPFEEAVRAAKAVAGRVRRAAGAVPETTHRQIYPPPDEQPPDRLSARDRQLRLTRLNALLLGGSDQAALDFWESSGLSNDPVARTASAGLIQEARDRLAGTVEEPPPPPPEPPKYDPRSEWRVISTGASMARLEQAIAHSDREAVLREWSDVQDTPGASRYAAVVHQFATDYWAGAIQQAARRDDAAGVLDAVAGADASGVPIPAGLRPLIREARQRTASAPEAAGEAAVITWEQQHPALARALAQDDDRLIARVIDEHRDEDFRDLPAGQRARVELALRRIRWAGEVRQALRRRNLAQLDRLAQQPPPGADQVLSSVERSRLARIRERREAQEQLNEALRSHSNRAFVQAMRRMELCSAPLPPDLDTGAFNEALDRITRLTALRRAVSDPGSDARTIARLVPAALGGGVNWETVEKMVNLEEVDRELVRSARVTRIREALKTDDTDAIAAAAMPDPHDVLRELNPEERERVEAAMKAAKPLAGRKSAMSLPEKRPRGARSGSDSAVEIESGGELGG